MQSLAYKAYGEVAQRTASDKEIEFALFEQITDALQNVVDPKTRTPTAWADAISRNQQLWTIIAADLVGEGNALPDELKRSLLFLSEFVRRASLDILSGEESIPDLIEVNRTVMAGLLRQTTYSADEEAA